MKIETQDLTWKPIVVTIETREEAQELFEHMKYSDVDVHRCMDLYLALSGHVK